MSKWSNYNPVKEYVEYVTSTMWRMKSISSLNARRSHIEELDSSSKIFKFCKMMTSNEHEVITSLGKYVYICFKWRLKIIE